MFYASPVASLGSSTDATRGAGWGCLALPHHPYNKAKSYINPLFFNALHLPGNRWLREKAIFSLHGVTEFMWHIYNIIHLERCPDTARYQQHHIHPPLFLYCTCLNADDGDAAPQRSAARRLWSGAGLLACPCGAEVPPGVLPAGTGGVPLRHFFPSFYRNTHNRCTSALSTDNSRGALRETDSMLTMHETFNSPQWSKQFYWA